MPVKILFADDSAADRLILKSMLPDYTVVTAVDGADALRQIREQPDLGLVVLDLNMPNMDGFQVLEALRNDARLRRLRTILLTSSDEMENEIRGLQLGAAATSGSRCSAMPCGPGSRPMSICCRSSRRSSKNCRHKARRMS